MTKTDYPPVYLSDILSAYWRGIKPWKWIFAASITLYIGVEIVNVIIPLYYKEFFDALAAAEPGDGYASLLPVILTVLVLNLSWWGMRWVAYNLHSIGESHTMPLLKQQAFDYLMGHSQGFFANTYTGSMVSRIQRFASGFERAMDMLVFNVIPLAINVGGAIIIVYALNPTLAATVAVWAIFFFGVNHFYSQWRFKHNLILSELDSKSSGTLADIVSNHSAVTLFAAATYEHRRYREITEEHAAKQRFLWLSNGGMDAFQLFFLVAVEFVVFYVALTYWNAGLLTIGTFVLLQAYILQIGSKLSDFGRLVRAIYEVHAQATEMLQIMKLPHEVRDTPGATSIQIVEGEVRFLDVVFNFNKTRAVFESLNVTIPGGQKVALVGPSGAGKTTFVRLLLRLYDTTGGSVCIDGQDIQKVTLDSLRSAIAFVPQDPVLFHRTLMENIRYGRPDATDEEVVAAAKLAHCDEFIDALPDKYQTFVGERGVKLSGGERQRVAIARAILKNAPILILDEATSSLDSHSEALIQDALDTLMKGKTVLVIAHRLSTIRKMDRILVIEEGKIREDGSHAELLKNPDSLYKQLWELQAGGFLKDQPA